MLSMRMKAVALSLTLLAGCDGSTSGAVRGPDGGAHDAGPPRACLPIPPPPSEWEPVQSGRPNGVGHIMTFGGETLFVVDPSFRRLLRSDDRGATWCYVPTPAPVLALHPTERTLYMIADDAVAPASPSDTPPPPPVIRPPTEPQPPSPTRILRSDDGGDTWRDPGGTLPRAPEMLFPWSSEPDHLVANLPDRIRAQELWLTLDGGAHWERLRPDGAPVPEVPLEWHWIFRYPGDAHTLVALATGLTDDPAGQRIRTTWLWTSTDEGVSWTRMTGQGPFQDVTMKDDGTLLGLTRSGDVVAGGLDPKAWTTLSHLALLRSTFLPRGNGKLYVQGLRDEMLGPISTLETSDGGRTWTTTWDDYVQRIPLAWWKGTSLELSGYGLRASDDNGKTWRTVLLNTGSTNFAAGGGSRFLTSGMAILRSSDDAPEVWTGIPFFDRYLLSFLPHPTLAGTAYAKMGTWVPGEMPSLARTGDGGKSWQPFPISVEGQPLARASIVAIAATTPPALFASGEGALVRSVDGGLTWSRLQLPSSTLIRPAPSDPNLIYAAAQGGIGVSKNGGLDWTYLTPEINVAGEDLIVDPVDPQVLYLVGQGPAGSLSTSKNGGMTWGRLPFYLPRLPHPIALSAARPGTLFYVDGLTGYVVETSDDGMTRRWHRPPGVVSGLAVDPAHPEVLYLSTSAGAFKQALR